MTTGITEQIETLCQPIVEKSGAFLLEVHLRGENRGKVLEVSIDTDEGVTTDECAAVSRELSQALDAADLIRGAYQLIVSSPGTDKPLRYLRQFKKNVGRPLALRLRGGDAPVEGVLVALDGETIVLTTGPAKGKKGAPEEILRVPYGEVAEARVKTPW